MVGTRDVDSSLARTEPGMAGAATLSEWLSQNPRVKVGTFAEAAAHGEVVFNATSGAASLAALGLAGSKNLDGKILIDVSNPLDFSKGMPPTLFVSNTDSLAEQIQAEFPDARVVKALNTVAFVMTDPGRVGDEDHHAFVSGNDDSAKAEVTRILKEWFGWRNVIHLGDITTARGTEMYLALWIRLFVATGTPMLNVKVVS